MLTSLVLRNRERQGCISKSLLDGSVFRDRSLANLRKFQAVIERTLVFLRSRLSPVRDRTVVAFWARGVLFIGVPLLLGSWHLKWSCTVWGSTPA